MGSRGETETCAIDAHALSCRTAREQSPASPRHDTSTHPQGFTICVKYIYEAQAAVQNAEGLKRGTAHLELCSSSRRAECVRPTNPRAPHHCVPTRAVCVRPEPVIAWRAQWLGNETDWYRWIDPAPW